jgi:hypothetical protein
MIARFNIFLNTYFYVPHDVAFRTLLMIREGYAIKVYPPRQAAFDASYLTFTTQLSSDEIIRKLEPLNPPNLHTTLLIDNTPSFRVNLLTIDFGKDEFDRYRSRTDEGFSRIDPPIELVFSVKY